MTITGVKSSNSDRESANWSSLITMRQCAIFIYPCLIYKDET